MDGEHHFEGVSAASYSEDGAYVYLELSGAPQICVLRLPVQEVTRVVSQMLQMAGAAAKAGNVKTIRATHVQGIGIKGSHSDPDKRILEVLFQADAPPLALLFPKDQLTQVAVGYLQTEGVLPSPRSDSVQ